MSAVVFVLLVLALVCFLVAAISGYAAAEGNSGGWHRVNFLALGLAFWVSTALIAAFPH